MINLKTILTTFLFFTVSTHAAQFVITNNCPYTVWAAAVPGGGQQLNSGQTWTISANPGQTGARIWARTGCTPTGPNGLRCTTGDCGGLLQCTAYGTPPNTLAEYALKQFNNLDFFDISLVDGFNVPMQFVPTSGGCSRGITCNADIVGQCPVQLKANGGCNNPCTVFKTDNYCCNSGSCSATDYSRYFKTRCPDAYSYPKDDATSTFTCPNGANYKMQHSSLSPKTALHCLGCSHPGLPAAAARSYHQVPPGPSQRTVYGPGRLYCNRTQRSQLHHRRESLTVATFTTYRLWTG